MWRWQFIHLAEGCGGISLTPLKFFPAPESPMLRMRLVLPAIFLLAYSCAGGAQEFATDPPSRVARLAYSIGDVQFAPAGESQWNRVRRNRPLVTGDRLLTGRNGRVALELGDSAIRINDDSAFDLLNLDDSTAQIELSQGALNLRVRQSDVGQSYEVDTPVLAFVAGGRGDYRIDVGPEGNGTIVTVFNGSGTVYGEDGASRAVSAHHSYSFDDSHLVGVTVRGLPAPDGFDRFNFARDGNYSRSLSQRYVSAGVIGYDDLDDNGDWQETSNYGAVWYPTNVAPNWAPYRDGQWEWVDPYGWTWVDNAQWGFAPYHYGRWVYVQDRWGWIPGERAERAVYAPALVAFVGGSGLSLSIGIGNEEPVGWFPLGPNDVYLPPYRVSRNYFNNVNVTNIRVVNNTVINNTIINNYYTNYTSPNAAQRINYTYRATPQAVTVVPRNVFAGARPVAPAILAIKPGTLVHSNILRTPHVVPSIASLGGKPDSLPAANPAKAFARPVVARAAPPPSVSFAAREKLIANQGGIPVSLPQLRQLQKTPVNKHPMPPQVRLIAPNAPSFGISSPAKAVTKPAMPPLPLPAARAAAANPAPSARAPAMRAGELPSARFAHTGAAPVAATPAIGAAEKTGSRGNTNMNAGTPHVRFLGPPEKRPGIHVGNAVAPPLPSAAAQPVSRPADGFVHAPQAPNQNVPAAGNAAQEHSMQRQAAQERAGQARQARASQSNALQIRAAQGHAVQAQQAQRAAAQEHVAQAQQAERAAEQDRAAQMQAQRAATQQRLLEQKRQTTPPPAPPKAKKPQPPKPNPETKDKNSDQSHPVQ
jgi:hypothetical protein